MKSPTQTHKLFMHHVHTTVLHSHAFYQIICVLKICFLSEFVFISLILSLYLSVSFYPLQLALCLSVIRSRFLSFSLVHFFSLPFFLIFVFALSGFCHCHSFSVYSIASVSLALSHLSLYPLSFTLLLHKSIFAHFEQERQIKVRPE